MWFEGPLPHRAQSLVFPDPSRILSSSFHLFSPPFLVHCLSAPQNQGSQPSAQLRPWLIDLVFRLFHVLRIWAEQVLQTLTTSTTFFVRRAQVPLVRRGHHTCVHAVPMSWNTVLSSSQTHLDLSPVVNFHGKAFLGSPN